MFDRRIFMTLRAEQVKRVRQYLLRGEKVLDIVFPSRISLLRYYSAALFLLVVSILSYRIPIAEQYVTRWMLVAFILVVAVIVIYAELRRHHNFLVITNLRVMHLSGIFTEHVIDVVMNKITDTSFSQNLIENIFNYGTITVNTPGTSGIEIVMRGVLYPDQRKRLIDSLIHVVHQQHAHPKH